MRVNRQIIGGRYQYSPNECLRRNQLYSQFRAYDKATKRDLILQLHNYEDSYVEKVRQIQNLFIHFVYDVVKLEDERKVAILFEPSVQATLEEALRNYNYLSENDALVIFKCALLGLKQLHERMIVYDRMTMHNILLCSHSIVRLGTFVYPGQVSIELRSPETLKGERTSNASDVYSLGVVLYRMLFGCYPFGGESEEEILLQIRNQEHQERPTVSPLKIIITKEVRDLCLAMLSFNPSDRPRLDEILSNPLLSFPIDTELQSYLKPKTNIMSEQFYRKYLVFRSSKIVYRYDEYYEESCYLGLNVREKEFVTLIIPDVRMTESTARKIESYYEKLGIIKENYTEEKCEFVCRVEDYERYKKEPLIVTEYCNQGDLFHYLDKRRKEFQDLTQNEILIVMYLLAISYKQMRDLGIPSMHTVHSQRVMINNKNIRLREPGIITPFLDGKLVNSAKIDYFAPELKIKTEFVDLSKTDMWSYGVIFYYLLTGKLPQLNPETKTIMLDDIDLCKKNKNLLAKCLDQNVNKRLQLSEVQLEEIDEKLLEDMLAEKRRHDEIIDDDLSSEAEEERYRNDNRLVFRNRKKRWFRNFNKVMVFSSTNGCRIWTKTFLGLILLWTVFFGLFFVNGGIGMLRTNYYRKITLEVPYNYATTSYNITILSTNGSAFQNEYKDYSFEQLTYDLHCTENIRSLSATGEVHDYINYSHSVQCFFGFVFILLFSISYGIVQIKMDLPKILFERRENGNNKGLILLGIFYCCLIALMFCFFSIFSLDYVIQMYPCLGIENQAYPTFTSVKTLLNGNISDFIKLVFPTVILWSVLMFVYILVGTFNKKVNSKLFEYKTIIPAITIILIYTLVCRIGFGSIGPLEPSWSYKMNTDLTKNYWGLFGFFPEVLMIPVFCLERLVDFIFWFFIKMGMEPKEEDEIREVEFVAKLQPVFDEKESEVWENNNRGKVHILSEDFETFE